MVFNSKNNILIAILSLEVSKVGEGLEQPEIEENVPAHGRGGTGGFLTFLPTQTSLEFYDNPLGRVNN